MSEGKTLEINQFRLGEPKYFYFSQKPKANLKYFISTDHQFFSGNFKLPLLSTHTSKKCKNPTKLGERGLTSKKQLIRLLTQVLYAPLHQADMRQAAACDDFPK